MTARRHHYVPVFYLKRFANDLTKQLFVADFRKHKSFTPSPEGVAVELDFNRVDVPGQPIDLVEKELSKFEGAIAAALECIINSDSLSDANDANLLFTFMSMLLIRNPGMRETVGDWINRLQAYIMKADAIDPEHWKETMQAAKADGTIPEDTDIEKIRQLILNDKFTVGLSSEAQLLMEFKNAEACVPYFARRQWNIYKATAGSFVTCDRPVVVTWADPKESRPPGLALPNTRILLALSSSVAMCGGFELENAIMAVGADDVAKINGRIILNARHQVYASGPESEYLLRHNPGAKRIEELLEDKGAEAAKAP